MLRIGTSIVEITPPEGVQLTGYPHCLRPNEGAHDPLYAGCIYLDDGQQQIAVVMLDILFFGKDFQQELEASFPFPVFIGCSHTHSGPQVGVVRDYDYAQGVRVDANYEKGLMAKLHALVHEASENTFCGTVGTFVGRCGAQMGVGGNRREKGGVCDPTVNVLAVKDASGAVRGILTSYALHPTYLHAENVLVSADYPGYIRSFLKFAYPEAVFLFAQGTSGDQSSRYHRTGQNFEEACRVGTTLGTEVFRCIEAMEFTDAPALKLLRRTLELPRKAFPPEEEARAARDAARQRFAQLQDADYITYRNAELDMFGAEHIYDLSREAASGFVDPDLPAQLQILKVGDCAIVGLQGEYFVELGLRIKANDRFPKTFVCTLVGGRLPGYLYTPDAIHDGGYEVGNSTFAPEAGPLVTENILAMLQEV